MTAHEQVLKSMREMAEKFSKVGVKLQMPPHSNQALGTRYTEIDFGKMLAAEIKFDSKFSNPMHVFQGGFLCSAFDEVYGPLTYMASERPVVTIEMSTTFLRPFREKDEFIIVRAEVPAFGELLQGLNAGKLHQCLIHQIFLPNRFRGKNDNIPYKTKGLVVGFVNQRTSNLDGFGTRSNPCIQW